MNADSSGLRFVSKADGEAVTLGLAGGVFLSIFCPSRSVGVGIAFPRRSMTARLLEKALTQAQSLLDAGNAALVCKAVGPAEQLQVLTQYLPEHRLRLENSSERSEATLTVIFHPLTGRLRVPKVEAAPSPSPSQSPAATRAVPLAKRNKIRVLVVDDSETIRKILGKMFGADPELEVVALASRPSEVEGLIARHRPDVITLDIHMPEMDGVTLLKKYLPRYPIPTVMITSVSLEEGPKVFEALEHGAVDYIQKPSFDQLAAATPLIVEKIKMAAQVQMRTKTQAGALPPATGALDESRLIAIGSSTGGTEALREVLTRLPAKIPPIVIVQHIPPVFSQAFAERLNSLCPFEVIEGRDGDDVIPGRVIIAPGGFQMHLVKSGHGLKVAVTDAPPVNRHKPSVDVMFDSVAAIVGRTAIGVILTGMGADGAKGMLKMKNAGCHTIAQDEASCVVFGMPREAIKLGGAVEVRSLLDIPVALQSVPKNRKAA